MAVQLILKNSSVEDRRPSANQLSNGEIALNFNEAGAFLTCRDTDGSMQQVGGVKVAETAPSTPVKQTIWLKPSTNALSIYSGSSWVTIGAVTSVNGQAGAVTLTAANVGLGNVNNTSDLSKPISTATQNALNTKADLVGGKVPTSQLPSLAVSEYLGPAADQAAMLLLSGERGDWCIRTDSSSTFVLVTDGGSSIGDWQELATPASPVSSVNGFTGAVALGASDVGAATAAQGATADSALQAGDNISDLTNDEGYISSIEAPVQSVNTQTGAVVLGAAEVGAVNLTGDNMTGNLTLGTSNIVLNASNGSAEFTSIAVDNLTLDASRLSSSTSLNIESSAPGGINFKTKAPNGDYRFYNTAETFYGSLRFNNLTAIRNFDFPNNGGTVALTSDISDADLKENIVDAPSQWADVKATRVKNFYYTEISGQPSGKHIGWIAQEVQAISPGCVVEIPEEDDEGNPTDESCLAIKTQVMLVKAYKALQEAMERIETLEQRLLDAGIA